MENGIQLYLDLLKQFAAIISEAMTGLAYLMGKAGQKERAIEVLTFARDQFHSVSELRGQIDLYLAELEAELLPERFAAAQGCGKAVQFDAGLQALVNPFSIQVDALPQQSRTVAVAIADPDQLTPREREVLSLVATGLTNRQIADRLVISPSTVNVHLNAVYGKLGVRSRAAATRYALEHNLC
jgi:DNA-binding NarL/FixJ family response regulator